MQDCEPRVRLKICVRTYMCSWRDMDSCDAGHVLGGIKNLQEKNKRLMLSACQDNSGPLVWFIYVCFGFFFIACWMCLCAFLQNWIFRRCLLLPPGFAGGWPSDGSQQVSPHTLGDSVQRGRLQGELRHSLFTPSITLFSSLPLHSFFFCLAPLASESCKEPCLCSVIRSCAARNSPHSCEYAFSYECNFLILTTPETLIFPLTAGYYWC